MNLRWSQKSKNFWDHSFSAEFAGLAAKAQVTETLEKLVKSNVSADPRGGSRKVMQMNISTNLDGFTKRVHVFAKGALIALLFQCYSPFVMITRESLNCNGCLMLHVIVRFAELNNRVTCPASVQG